MPRYIYTSMEIIIIIILRIVRYVGGYLHTYSNAVNVFEREYTLWLAELYIKDLAWTLKNRLTRTLWCSNFWYFSERDCKGEFFNCEFVRSRSRSRGTLKSIISFFLPRNNFYARFCMHFLRKQNNFESFPNLKSYNVRSQFMALKSLMAVIYR